MKRYIIFFVVLCVCMTSSSLAAVIVYTSFEEVSGAGSKYLGRFTSPLYLPNRTGEMIVDYTGGAELGFSTYYNGTNGPNATDETTGDYVGAASYFPHTGNNCFQLEDCDPECSLELDSVSLSGWTGVELSFWFKTPHNGFEINDWVKVEVVTDIGTYTVLDMDGTAVNNHNAAHGTNWVNYTISIDDAAAYADFRATLHSNASLEDVNFDDIVFTGVPEPSTLSILGLGYLVFLRKKQLVRK